MPETHTPFSELARVCSALRATSKRLEKRSIIASFLRKLNPEEVSAATLLLIGRIFPESERKTLNVGWATLQKATGAGRQATLIESPLTILDVQDALTRIATISGPDSVRLKRHQLEGLLGRATKDEREVIFQNIFGEMRHGVSEGVMLEAISDASNVDKETVHRANMLSGDIGLVSQVALRDGADGLRQLDLRLFTPVKPMLAEESPDAEKVFEEHGGRTALEYKFDGARIQIHRSGNDMRIFSRRLSDVTRSVPEIVEFANTFQAESLLIEGEVIAIDKTGKPLPFQDLMRRFRRVHDIDAAMQEIPLELHVFDILFLNGRSLIDEPYETRWTKLTSVVPAKFLTKRLVATNPKEFDSFLSEALQRGHEGIMAKRLDSKYVPGKRGKLWLKIKPADTLDMVIVAAEWGSGRRKGWLSNYHLAVKEGDSFAMVGKTFKGLTDEQFRWMTSRLQELKVTEKWWGVEVRPEIVVEVDYNEIQKSPRYKSGFALRFARIKRIREDKQPTDADTIDRLNELYIKQFERKGRISNV